MPGADRRQCRRQVHAVQGDVGHLCPGWRADPAGRQARALFHAVRGACAEDRDGLSGPVAVRSRRCRRKPVPGPRAEAWPVPGPAPHAGRGRTHAGGAGDPHPAPDRQGGEAVGRSAPGHRHRTRRQLRPQGADHGRADLGPGRGRGRGRAGPDQPGQGARRRGGAGHAPDAGPVPRLRPHRRHVRGHQGRRTPDPRHEPSGTGRPDRRQGGH